MSNRLYDSNINNTRLNNINIDFNDINNRGYNDVNRILSKYDQSKV